MKRRIKAISTATIIIVTLTVTSIFAGGVFSTNEKRYGENLGSCAKLEGNVIIVSIYANDTKYKWNENALTDTTADDYYTITDTKEKLKIATEYLTENVSKYGKDVNFIYDWQENSDLQYTAEFGYDMLTMDTLMYEIQNEFIENNIKTKKLKQKYHADNIAYMFFFNTNQNTIERSYAIGNTLGTFYDNEIINITCYNQYGSTMPGTYAHEIMHLFGAPDLYCKNTWISEEYVEYLAETNSQDLMYTVNTDFDENYNIIITAKFTQLDAYYVGLTDYSKDQQEWKLARSQHMPLEDFKVLEGDNQVFDASSTENLTFEFDYDYGMFYNFGNVTIDNVELSEINYTMQNTNTIVTVEGGYTKNLENGKHTLELYLTDLDGEKIPGSEVTTNFTVTNGEKNASYSKNANLNNRVYNANYDVKETKASSKQVISEKKNTKGLLTFIIATIAVIFITILTLRKIFNRREKI